MSDFTILNIDLIVSNPRIRGGRPILAGTTLRVQDIAEALRFQGYTAAEMAAQFALSLAQVHAALAYYYTHQVEIDQQIDEDLSFARAAKDEDLGKPHPPVSG